MDFGIMDIVNILGYSMLIKVNQGQTRSIHKVKLGQFTMW